MYRSLSVALVLTALTTVACGNLSRPSVTDWEPAWEAAVAGVPSQTALGNPPSRQLCDDAVAFLRASEEGLVPTPDRAIDATVEEWLDVAKDAFFECPPASSRMPDFAAVYSELARLEAEVAVVLEMDRSAG